MRISDWSSDVCSSDLWHSNIMTIHRMLGFYPEFYDAVDPDSGEMRQTMRFVPSYNKENLLPWDIIVVDEAGMCGLDLWHLIWAACKPTTRIFLVGDRKSVVEGKRVEVRGRFGGWR